MTAGSCRAVVHHGVGSIIFQAVDCLQSVADSFFARLIFRRGLYFIESPMHLPEAVGAQMLHVVESVTATEMVATSDSWCPAECRLFFF